MFQKISMEVMPFGNAGMVTACKLRHEVLSKFARSIPQQGEGIASFLFTAQ